MVICSSVFSRDLEKDISGDTSGHFKKFLIALLQVQFELSSASVTGKVELFY